MTPCEVCGSLQPVHTHHAPAGSQFGDTLVVRTPPALEMPMLLPDQILAYVDHKSWCDSLRSWPPQEIKGERVNEYGVTSAPAVAYRPRDPRPCDCGLADIIAIRKGGQG